MTAKELMTTHKSPDSGFPERTVEAAMPVIDVIPRLLDAPHRELAVNEEGEIIGIIDRDSLLEGLGRMIVARDDCSVITVECRPEDYSASHLAHAVEDSDAHLVDLWTSPASDGNISVMLRVRHRDPSAAVRSLERYNYHVVEAHGVDDDTNDATIAAERLLSLQTLLSV